MIQVKKKEGKTVRAYCLGEPHPILDALVKEGRIRRMDKSHWRILSHEANEGEAAVSGDYIKIDSSGAPYPNTRAFFLENHRHIRGDEYEQIPRVLNAWRWEDGMCPEIRFLTEHKGLVFHEENEKAYFSAPLWGDVLSAAKDAVIVFYDLKYAADGAVADADFNFVDRDEFVKTYDVIAQHVHGKQKRKENI